LLGDFKRFTSKEVVKAIIDNPRESRREWLLEQVKKQEQSGFYFICFHNSGSRLVCNTAEMIMVSFFSSIVK